MPWNQRRMNAPLCPTVPLINVQIGSADRCDFYFNQNFRTAEFRHSHLTDFCAGCGGWLHDCEHGLLHKPASRQKQQILAPCLRLRGLVRFRAIGRRRGRLGKLCLGYSQVNLRIRMKRALRQACVFSGTPSREQIQPRYLKDLC